MRIARLEMQRVGVFEDETIEFRPKTDPDKAEILPHFLNQNLSKDAFTTRMLVKPI